MIRHIFKLVLLLIILSGFIACEKKADSIGFLYTSKETAKRFYLESQFFAKRIQELGYQAIVEDANDNDILQIERANTLFDKGIKALVLIPVNGNTASAIVREGNRRGIPVIAYVRLVKNCDLPLFVASDAKALGKLIVDEAVKYSNHGNYVILGGAKDDMNAVAMHDGQIEALAPYSGKINVVYDTYIEKWSPSKCAYEFEQFLNLFGNDISAVFPGYDGMAYEVIRIVKERGLDGKVFISGQDAELGAIHKILDGDLHMTLFHPIDDLARLVADKAVEMADGKKPEKQATHKVYNGERDVPSYLLPSLVITRDNIDEILIKRGFYTHDQVYLR